MSECVGFLLTWDEVGLEQENVLGESKMMIPDCRKRLESALQSLQTAVVSVVSNHTQLLNVKPAGVLCSAFVVNVRMSRSFFGSDACLSKLS